MGTKGVLTFIGLGLLAYMIPHLWLFMRILGFHNTVYNHAPGSCHIREEIPHGAEDVQVLSNGLAFISSGIRLLEVIHSPKFQDITGNIYLFDFNNPKQKAIPLNIKGAIPKDEFNPHGIFALEENDRILLYVVNHYRNSSSSLMKFSFNRKAKSLSLVGNFFDDNIRYANDIYALDEDQLYFSNYLYTPSVLEMYLGLAWHSIGFYDKGVTKLVVSGLSAPNGVNMSPDKKYLYTPNAATRTIDVYMRQTDNSLELVQKYPVYMPCDNIDVHRETGDLWTGCFPVGHKIMKYLHDPEEPSPPKILKLSTKDGLISGMSEVYASDGAGFRGCTIGVRYKNQMLAGAIYTPPLYCELNYVDP